MRKYTKGIALTLLAFLIPLTASADPIYVEYEIDYYATLGYSASWKHAATGCESPAADGRGTLYMCGGDLTRIAGTIAGMLHAGVLRDISGLLTNYHNGDISATIVGGALRPFVSGADSSFFIFGNGDRAFFEVFNMGSGLPNYFDGEEFILWGQNTAAYRCQAGDSAYGQ